MAGLFLYPISGLTQLDGAPPQILAHFWRFGGSRIVQIAKIAPQNNSPKTIPNSLKLHQTICMNHKILNNVLTVEEWDKLGISKSMIRTRLQRQEMVRLDTAVYARLDFMESLSKTEKSLAKIVAVNKALDSPVFSHQSAALWLGAPLTEIPSKVHVSLPNNSGKHRKDISAHRNRPDVCAQSALYQGLSLTCAEQIVVDCVSTVSLHDSLSIANYFLRQEILTFDSLFTKFSEPHTRHQIRIKALMERINPICESPLETIIWSHIYDWKIEKPEQ